MAGKAASEPTSTPERVRFQAGTFGVEVSEYLTPGGSNRDALGAKNGHYHEVRIAPRSPSLDYQIFDPDGSSLFEMAASDRNCRGQPWQSAYPVDGMINRSNSTAGYDAIFGVEQLLDSELGCLTESCVIGPGPKRSEYPLSACARAATM